MNVPNPLTEPLLASELDNAKVRFDWRPNVENGRVTFEADLIRGDRRSAISFEINLLKLTEAQLTRLRTFLERRHAGVTTHYEMVRILCWLVDYALFQTHPEWSKSFRDAEVRKLLLV